MPSIQSFTRNVDPISMKLSLKFIYNELASCAKIFILAALAKDIQFSNTAVAFFLFFCFLSCRSSSLR